ARGEPVGSWAAGLPSELRGIQERAELVVGNGRGREGSAPAMYARGHPGSEIDLRGAVRVHERAHSRHAGEPDDEALVLRGVVGGEEARPPHARDSRWRLDFEAGVRLRVA